MARSSTFVETLNVLSTSGFRSFSTSSAKGESAAGLGVAPGAVGATVAFFARIGVPLQVVGGVEQAALQDEPALDRRAQHEPGGAGRVGDELAGTDPGEVLVAAVRDARLSAHCAHYTHGDRVRQVERIADGHDPLPNLQRVAVSQFGGGEGILFADLDQRQVELVVSPLQLCLHFPAVGELHKNRIAVMDHAHRHGRACHQGIEHDTTDDCDNCGVKRSARAKWTVNITLTLGTTFDVHFRVIGNETCRAIEFRHHLVTGINAEPALDAGFVLGFVTALLDAHRRRHAAILRHRAHAQAWRERCKVAAYGARPPGGADDDNE